MKKDLDLDDFKMHIRAVDDHTKYWVSADASDAPLVLPGGEERKSVGAFDAGGRLVMAFPSVATAARMIASTALSVQKVVDSGKRFHRCFWRHVGAETYRSQNLAEADAFHHLSLMRFARR